ncbi:plasma membrane heat shock protein [Scheffersomyces xylosifermentans]|uniref:plasma membrane heat shock protein n=1 Tax=Scheffersomyces xylosifermentans TaxID=1304137 RepID=UPI00315D2E4A
MNAAIEFFKRNDVMEVNSMNLAVDIHITSHGSSWLWTVFCLFGVSALFHVVAYALTNSSQKGLKKTLLVVPIFLHTIMSVAYFTMASNLGYAGAPVEFHGVTTSQNLGFRQIFYSKWISYFLGFPWVLLLIELTTRSAFSEGDLLTRLISFFQGWIIKILALWVLVLALLIGTLIVSTYKWGYFSFAVAALLLGQIYIFINGLQAWKHSPTKLPLIAIFFSTFIWILYPIAWGVSEGGNQIQPDSEAVWYGILDLINFLVLPIILTWSAIKNLDNESFSKGWHFKKNEAVEDPEKEVGETPRHSGDTAVAPNGVPVDE